MADDTLGGAANGALGVEAAAGVEFEAVMVGAPQEVGSGDQTGDVDTLPPMADQQAAALVGKGRLGGVGDAGQLCRGQQDHAIARPLPA